MDDFSENEFLLLLAVKSIKGEKISHLPEGLDYSALFSKAARAGVFQAVVNGIDDALLPDAAKTTRTGIAVKEGRKLAEAEAMLSGLRGGGVDCLPLDGFAFGALYTGGAKREIKDFNILVRDSQLAAADRILSGAGMELFRESEGLACYRGKSRPMIFLHTQSGAYGGTFPLWEMARPLQGESNAFTLTPEVRLLCVLGRIDRCVKNGVCALKAFLDATVLINTYTGTMNDEYLLSLTQAYGLDGMLETVKKLYGCLFDGMPRDGEYFRAVQSFFDGGEKKLPPPCAGPISKSRRRHAKTMAIYVSVAAVVLLTVVICAMLLPSTGSHGQSSDMSEQSSLPQVFTDDGEYSGEVSDGLPNGEGRMEYDSGDVYEGSFSAGKREGYGIYTFANGDRYEGNFSADTMSGEGSFYFASGDIITGEFENGLPNGGCVCTYSDGNVYTGSMKDGVRSGYGIFTFANGDKYEGSFENGSRNGYGEYTYSDGSVYKGDWKDGVQEGQGVFSSGEGTYTGGFSDGVFNGDGRYVFANGDVYEGGFTDGVRCDESASLIYADGGSYVGAFENDLFNGQGTLTFSNGNIAKGTFVNGLLEGVADFYLKEYDTWQKIRYEAGKIVEYIDE